MNPSDHSKITTSTGRLPGLLCLIMVACAPAALAGTDGFGLGLDDLPFAEEAVRQTVVDEEMTPWRPEPPVEPIYLPFPSMNQPPSFARRIGRDFVGLAVAPIEWNGSDWAKVGVGVLAVGAVSLLDEDINNWADRTRSQGSIKVIEAYRPLGEYGGLALLGLTWVAGRASDRPKLTAVAEDGIEATIFAAGVVTPLMKTVFGRTRPRHTDNSHTFGGSGHSFPSGEATQAFAIASVIAAHSESPWTKAAAWGGASLVGLGRIGLDGHWASDVVAGALIGAAVGTWVVRRNRPDLESNLRMTWIPAVGKDHYGLAMHVTF